MSARRVASVQVSVTDFSGKLAGMIAISPTRVLYKARVGESELEEGGGKAFRSRTSSS